MCRSFITQSQDNKFKLRRQYIADDHALNYLESQLLGRYVEHPIYIGLS